MPSKTSKPAMNKRLSAKGEFPTIRYLASRDKFEVDAGTRLGGTKKYRRWFKTEAEARGHADTLKIRLKNEGTAGFKLSREEQIDAEKALKTLDGRGTLQEACEFFIRYLGENGSNLNVKELVDEFIENKERQRLLGEKGASERTIKDYRHRLGLLSEHFKSIPLNEFRERDFEDWILARGDVRGLTRTTKALFSYAVEQKYIPENPLKKRTPVPKIDKPSILSDKDWKSLVRTALASQEHRNANRGEKVDLLACTVLGLWCGLRPEAELKRLDWSDVNIEDGFVNIHDDWKVKIGRHVTIPDCAKVLLKKCVVQEGPVVSQKNFRRRWDWLRKEAEVYKSWDSDIMRHTFASMHYAYYGNKQQVINELGHCNSSMLRYYINHGVKIKKQAKAFFNFKIN
jgi:integrase